MTIFAEKLLRLVETISLVANRQGTDVSQALRSSRGRTAVAVGSGGSIVAAEYFARCRSTLGLGVTMVMTPMELVLSMEDWSGCEIWLFSAGADNPDIAAAFRTAKRSRASSIHLMTVRESGATALMAAAHARSQVYVLPVADPKDGFLATHSMTAMVTALLLASDSLCERPSGAALVNAFVEASEGALMNGLDGPARTVAAFVPGDTLLVVHDPQVRTIAVLIETSLWETGIAPVQRTDFRNFAHGRHVWAAKHPSTMFALALTSNESLRIWRPIESALPANVRRGFHDLDNAGRLRNAIGVIEGLELVRALGEKVGIDPGRPGRGTFAEVIYDDASLEEVSQEFTPAVRQKLAAHLMHDPLDAGYGLSVCAIGRGRLEDLGVARFRGLVLDYDGTVVETEARLEPPDPRIVDELVRLVDGGILLGFATGRGGSAGDMLRKVLPERMHPAVTMGYYNGGHIRTLDVNIDEDQPAQDPAILEVADWIEQKGLLVETRLRKRGRVQLMLNHKDLADPDRFADNVALCPAVRDERVRVLSSHHSFDVVSRGATKLSVLRALSAKTGDPDALVLGIGDSGSPIGNDNELLSGAHGISVDSVCGSLSGCWSFFGAELTGPGALLRILEAVEPSPQGAAIDTSRLWLDERTR